MLGSGVAQELAEMLLSHTMPSTLYPMPVEIIAFPFMNVVGQILTVKSSLLLELLGNVQNYLHSLECEIHENNYMNSSV